VAFSLGSTLTNVGLKLPDVDYTPLAVSANSTADQALTVTGAVVGDKVVVGFPATGPNTGIRLHAAWVSAANQVTVRIENTTGAGLTPTAPWKIAVFKT
jgi:hypothetical protein